MASPTKEVGPEVMTATSQSIIDEYLVELKTMTYEEVGAKHGISKQAVWAALKNYRGYRPATITFTEKQVSSMLHTRVADLRHLVHPAKYGRHQWRYTHGQIIKLKEYITRNSVCACGNKKLLSSRICKVCNRAHRWSTYTPEQKKYWIEHIRQWRQANRERVREYNRQYQARKRREREAIL